MSEKKSRVRQTAGQEAPQKIPPNLLADTQRVRLRDIFTARFKALSRTAARVAGCTPGEDFEAFHGEGVAAFYGGYDPHDIRAIRGLDRNQNYLDYMGTFELRMNNERLRVVNAALQDSGLRGDRKGALEIQKQACRTLRSQFEMSAGVVPESFRPVEHIRNVHGRLARREAAAAQAMQPARKAG